MEPVTITNEEFKELLNEMTSHSADLMPIGLIGTLRPLWSLKKISLFAYLAYNPERFSEWGRAEMLIKNGSYVFEYQPRG